METGQSFGLCPVWAYRTKCVSVSGPSTQVDSPFRTFYIHRRNLTARTESAYGAAVRCDRKSNGGYARHLIRRQSGAIARHVFARIHLRCRFPSWSPRYIHVPEVPLHDTVGFLHRLGEIPSRRPVSENVGASTSGFIDAAFQLFGKTRSECKNPTVSCMRSDFDELSAE